jgi:4-carboxymuconolactone decarboxylase
MARIADAPLPPGTHGLMQNNLHRALANNPAMAEGFYGLANAVHTTSHLPARVRELAILRVTANLRSDFEFSHHFRGCQTVGVSAEEARAVRDGRFAGFSEAERAALALAEAVEARRVTDELWAAAAAHFPQVELLDLVMAASFYGYASRLCLALGVPADEGFPTIDEA